VLRVIEFSFLCLFYTIKQTVFETRAKITTVLKKNQTSFWHFKWNNKMNLIDLGPYKNKGCVNEKFIIGSKVNGQESQQQMSRKCNKAAV